MSNEKMTVCLEDFIKYILRKWKLLVAIAFLTALAFAAVALKLGKEITVAPSEQFLYLSEQEAVLDDYMEHSIIMKMDAQNVYKRNIAVSNISNVELLKEFATSGEIWKNKEEEVSLEYMMESLVWGEGNDSETVELKLRHYDEELCGEYAEYIAAQLREYDRNMNVAVGPQEVGSDDSVLMIQLGKYDLHHKVQSQLEVAAAGYTIQVSPVIACAVGGFFGVFLVIVSLFFKYLFKDQFVKV